MGALAALSLAAIVWIWCPHAVLGYLCPSCFGLTKVAENIYAEPGGPDPAPIIADARARVAAYYGSFAHQPTLLICHSEACRKRLSSGYAKAMTYGTTFIYVSPRGLRTDILAHEFSHVELHARIGLWGMLTGALPAWFDEGMAVLVSQDKRYLGPDNKAENCDGVSANTLPETNREWRRRAGGHAQALYHGAGCAAQARLAEKGGLEAAMQF